MLRCVLLFSLWTTLARSVSGIRMPIRRAVNPHLTSVNLNSAWKNDQVQLANKNGVLYTATFELNGEPVEIQIDTGSSDFWVDTNAVTSKNFTETGMGAFINYVDETLASGDIVLGNLTLGDFTVEKQAFINAPGSNATHGVSNGIVGLGPTSHSIIHSLLNGTKSDGRTFLDHIFSMHPSDPNTILVALSRSVNGAPEGGTFTIVEIPPEYSAVKDAPPLQILSPDTIRRWITAVDGVLVNGELITSPTNTSGLGVSANQMVGIIDTGASFMFAPRQIVDGIYGSVTGSVFSDDDSVYLYPCDAIIDVSVVFPGGVSIQLHPFDLGIPINNTMTCGGVIVPFDSFTDYDMVLGDVFLRNTAILFDYGTFTSVGTSQPHVRLLSITDFSQAVQDFPIMNQGRLAILGAAAPNGSKAVGALENIPSSLNVDVLKRNTYVILGLSAGIIAMVAVLSFFASSRTKGYNVVAAGAPYQDDKQYQY